MNWNSSIEMQCQKKVTLVFFNNEKNKILVYFVRENIN